MRVPWRRTLLLGLGTGAGALALVGGDGADACDKGCPNDTHPPETKIVKHPPKRGPARRVRFVFRTDEGKVKFFCRLDDQPEWKLCRKRMASLRGVKRYRVGRGRHLFRVYALDIARNADPTPAKFRWRRTRR